MFKKSFLSAIITKKIYIITSLMVCFFWGEPNSFAQSEFEKYKSDYVPPLNIPPVLSGNFAELRSNHFHSGIDYKTQQRIGLPINCIYDGVVVRVKISPYGYGKAIYIEHPNGITSVYAHLNSFEPKLGSTITKMQYQKNSFSIDQDLKHLNIKYKKGAIIGYSGNTGSSGGPHLHFELRETATQKPINPMLLGFTAKDNIPPHFESVMLVPANKKSQINGKNEALEIKVKRNNEGFFTPIIPQNISISGTVGVAVNAYDKLDNANNVCGVYELKLLKGQNLIAHTLFNRINYSHQRFLNAYTYYPLRKGNNFHRLHKLPNNPIENFLVLKNNGFISVEPNEEVTLKILANDFAGNTSTLIFNLKGTEYIETDQKVNLEIHNLAQWNQPFNYQYGDLSVYIPKNSLYESTPLHFSKSEEIIEGALSPIFTLHNTETPLHNTMEVTFLDRDRLIKKPTKIVVAKIDEKGSKSAISAKYQNSEISFKTRDFGSYAVFYDTIPPKVQPKNIPQKIGPNSTISFLISDDFSGIDKISPSLNGKWILYEWDPKTKLLSFKVDPEFHTIESENKFELKVYDAVGNFSLYELNLPKQ
jgi:hypothetical protein